MENSLEVTEESFWLPNCIDSETSKGIYHSDWRNYLNEKNRDEVSRLVSLPYNTQRFALYSKRIVQFFLKCVNDLGMPPEVLYLALDIFDRFWVNFLCKNPRKENCLWLKQSEYPIVLKKDGCLISLSCVQLASKLSSSGKVLPVSVIVEWMKTFGFAVDKKEVMTSEFDVFKVVRWTMPSVTTLSYVEMFLEEMTALLAGIRRSELLQVCIKVINVSLVFHKEIYTKLHMAFKNRELRTTREKMRFLSVEGDSIRLAASVVCAGAMLYDPSNKLADDMMRYLATTTSYQAFEIKVLSQIIAHIILRDLDSG